MKKNANLQEARHTGKNIWINIGNGWKDAAACWSAGLNTTADLAEEELGAVRFASEENKLDAESVRLSGAHGALFQPGEQRSVARLWK